MKRKRKSKPTPKRKIRRQYALPVTVIPKPSAETMEEALNAVFDYVNDDAPPLEMEFISVSGETYSFEILLRSEDWFKVPHAQRLLFFQLMIAHEGWPEKTFAATVAGDVDIIHMFDEMEALGFSKN